MFLRLLLLIQLISLMGPGSSASADDSPRHTGSEGFGRVIQVVFYLGVLVLIAIIIFGLLSIAGDFKISHLDPRT